ncbi:MAG TPA: exopolysaccharide biosynthesis polyprenyl glycosylphosphotransferase [Chloroflexota bacterium]|nr:exopolysaccharide biosynthesis polyprenyl glycosylphosphotransferase [Chloroflexota bacterium]
MLLEIAGVCGSQRVNVWMLPDHFQLMVSMVGEEQLAGLPLMTINDVRLKGVSRLTKRLVDIVTSTLLLIVLSAPLLLIALAVWIDSRGQIFYVQQRMGHDGKRFSMIKFRSMRTDAEAQGRNWTIENDPRVTRVGRFLRRFSLDEIPQLMNVLKGEMSLVGPRPEQPEYVERFSREYPRFLERHREKAGMSGWAQVNGLRGDVSITERTLYDLYYVENWSLGLDLRILLRTVVEVVRGRAY